MLLIHVCLFPLHRLKTSISQTASVKKKKRRRKERKQTVMWSKSNKTQREPEAIKHVRRLDIRSRRRNLMGTDEQKASQENWTEERFNVIIGDTHLSENGVIMSNQ